MRLEAKSSDTREGYPSRAQALRKGPMALPQPPFFPVQKPQVDAQLVCAQVTTVVSFVEPVGCAVSHAAAHAPSEQAS
jgi:hypothetical protein